MRRTLVIASALLIACATDTGSSGPERDVAPTRDVPDRPIPALDADAVPDAVDEAGARDADDDDDGHAGDEPGPEPTDAGDDTSDAPTVPDVAPDTATDVDGPDLEADATPDAEPDSGPHECVGAPATCDPAPGNECCAGACDSAAGCTTAPGACGGTDVCSDPNRLEVGRLCVGCGPPNAAGRCADAEVRTCDATTHRLCEQVACGGSTYVCSNVGGQWRWSTETACDDGKPCTFADICFGGACVGTDIACDDTDCVDRECDGTNRCLETPRVGAACDDADACTLGTTCSAAGVCGGGASAAVCGDGACTCGETRTGCAADCTVALPDGACSTGAQSRTGCANARTISRGAAAAGWSSGMTDTCRASNAHDGDGCPGFDVGYDHTYALFVRAGERVVAELAAGTAECASGETFSSYLKMRFNPDPSAAGARACPQLQFCVGGPNEDETWTAIRDWVAPADGWLFVIVDGGATAWDEHRGYYQLRVSLSRCDAAGCGC